MRILLATNYQPPHLGGIEFAAQSLKACWERDGHTVTWVTTDVPRGAGKNAPDNLRVAALNFLEDRWQVNTPLVSPSALFTIRRLLRTHDVVNVHSLAPGLSAVALHCALHARKPTVVTQHVGIIPLQSRLLSRFQETFIVNRARRAVQGGALMTFVGLAVRDWFVEHAGLPPEQTFMTPAGIDHVTYHLVTDAERTEFRARWKLEHGPLNVLFVGRFVDKKGLPLIRELAARCPAARFTLLGSGPIDPSSWGRPNVRVVDFVSNADLRSLYGAHDLFIMPSFGEGWPAVVPQAMACGLACLISEETFEGYRKDPDRFLICPRSADQIVHKLQEAAEGRIGLLAQRRELAEYATTNWDWQKTSRIYGELFEKVRSNR